MLAHQWRTAAELLNIESQQSIIDLTDSEGFSETQETTSAAGAVTEHPFMLKLNNRYSFLEELNSHKLKAAVNKGVVDKTYRTVLTTLCLSISKSKADIESDPFMDSVRVIANEPKANKTEIQRRALGSGDVALSAANFLIKEAIRFKTMLSHDENAFLRIDCIWNLPENRSLPVGQQTIERFAGNKRSIGELAAEVPKLTSRPSSSGLYSTSSGSQKKKKLIPGQQSISRYFPKK